MGDGGNINLMPEDLRSKESGAVSKKNQSFDPDLVLPGGLKPKIKGPKVHGPSFWDKLKAMFASKPKAPKPADTSEVKTDEIKKDKHKHEEHKVKYEVKHVKSVLSDEVKQKNYHSPAMHVPKPGEKPKAPKPVVKQDFSVPKTSEQQMPKLKGPSFWDKLKAMFASKPKAPKPPKIKIPKEEGEHKPKPDFIKSVLIEEVKKNGKSDASKPAMHVPEVEEQSKDKKDGIKQDFSIPKAFELSAKVAAPQKKEEQVKAAAPQFHQPEPRIRAKFISEGGGVDLIPQSAKTRSWKQVLNLIAVSFVGAAIVVGLFYITLFFQQQRKESQKQSEIQQISDLEKKILDYEDLNNEIDALGKEIRLVHSVLNLHFYWTNFFELLEKYTVSDVYYAGFTAGSGGGLTIQAVAKDFDAVAKQLKVLQQPEAMEFVWFVDISSATKAENGVSFNMTLGLNPFLFYYNESLAADTNGMSDNQDDGTGEQ